MSIIGHGGSLKVGDGATPEVFTAIPGIQNFDDGSKKVDMNDATAMDTPGNRRVFIPGLVDEGEFTLTVIYTPGEETLASLRAGLGTTKNFQARYAAPFAEYGDDFAATITDFSISRPDDKIVTASVKLKVSGMVTPVTPTP